MDKFTSQIISDLRTLREALSSKDDLLIDQVVSNLEGDLLGSENFKSIWDERLLSKAYRLLSFCYDQEADDMLLGLADHINNVHGIFDNFYSILSIENLDVLLFKKLTGWPLLEEPILCDFSDQIKDNLHAARSETRSSDEKLQNFLDVYLRYIADNGYGEAISIIQPYIKVALLGYQQTNKYTVQGLLITTDLGTEWGECYGLKVGVEPQGSGNILSLNKLSPNMVTASKHALAYVKKISPKAKVWDFTWEFGDGYIGLEFEGESVGLPLAIGIMAKLEAFDIDSFTAFTGRIEWDTGNIKRISHLEAKFDSAKSLGIRRVIIPLENAGEAEGYEELKVIPVETLQQAISLLKNPIYENDKTPMESLANAKIRHLQIKLEQQNIWFAKQNKINEFTTKVVFSDRRIEVPVNVYYSKNLVAVVEGKESPLRANIQNACDEVFGKSKEKTNGKQPSGHRQYETYFVHGSEMQKSVQEYLTSREDSIQETEKNCLYRIKIVNSSLNVFVRQFFSGKLTIDGESPLFDDVDESVRAIIGAPENYKEQGNTKYDGLKKQVEAVETVNLTEKWIGTDESGKGDYYGPLVGAAVFVDKRIASLLEELGVRDSKRLSDKKNHELAVKIKQVCGERAHIVVIPPDKYNELYDQFVREKKNLNTLLAWAHTRALEDILINYPQDQITVLVDKFADERYIQSKLLEKGRTTNLHLVQLPKAEANIAVAAASILARSQFLKWLDRLSNQYHVDLPKGSSDPRIIQVGKEVVEKFGEGELRKIAKLHFKTTKKIV